MRPIALLLPQFLDVSFVLAFSASILLHVAVLDKRDKTMKAPHIRLKSEEPAHMISFALEPKHLSEFLQFTIA